MPNKRQYISPIISERVRSELWKRNITGTELAKVLGCSLCKAYNIINKPSSLTAENIRAICIYYKINPIYLLNLEAYDF